MIDLYFVYLFVYLILTLASKSLSAVLYAHIACRFLPTVMVFILILDRHLFEIDPIQGNLVNEMSLISKGIVEVTATASRD